MHPWIQKYRRFLLFGVPFIFCLIILLFYLFGGRYVSTDDAYVQAGKASVSANVSGQVVKIFVHDNQVVRKGECLFQLDKQPYQIAFNNAAAKLTAARLQVQSLKAAYQQQLANVNAAKETYYYQTKEFERQKKLSLSGISSQMTLNKAENTFDTAKQQWAAAAHQLSNILASLGNSPETDIEKHPIVLQAKAALDKAKLDLFYTTVTASIDGIVTKVEMLQVGDYISTGAPVFSLVSDKNIWVEANFKETQITYMRPGQQAVVIIDAYPNKKFTGHMVSTSPGTGSSFSLLPPENATGNWVKIVQRVPVRVAIDTVKQKEMLHAGLSAEVTIDTHHSRLFSDRVK